MRSASPTVRTGSEFESGCAGTGARHQLSSYNRYHAPPMRSDPVPPRQPLLFQPVEAATPFSFARIVDETRAVWFPGMDVYIEVRFAVTSALARERKLTPKNLMNEASVRALVRMARRAQTARYLAEPHPCTAAT